MPDTSLLYGIEGNAVTDQFCDMLPIRYSWSGLCYLSEAMDLGTRTIASAMAAGLLAAALGGSSACRQQPSAEQAAPPPQTRLDTVAPTAPERATSKPESAGDREIRRELRTAIEQDPTLKDRAISFTVNNGDIAVTGHVRSETERQKINELAMQIARVKSVANALRVLPS